MSDTPPTNVNGTATTVNKIISAMDNAGVQVVEAMIIADVPFLGWPGIKQIWEGFFAWIASYFIKAEENGATFAVIDIQVGSEESGISKALAAVIAAEKSGDKDAIAKAIQDYQSAQSALVHNDGSAPAQS